MNSQKIKADKNSVSMSSFDNTKMYEYYYRRGDKYFFRSILGNIMLETPDMPKLKRGKEYEIEYEV